VTFLNGKDCPDLVAGIRGHNVMIEVKTGTAKLRPGQAEWAAQWRGAPPVVLRNVKDALVLLKILERAR
jgi:Holliday junction resolvase